jgi:hypothetical protein
VATFGFCCCVACGGDPLEGHWQDGAEQADMTLDADLRGEAELSLSGGSSKYNVTGTNLGEGTNPDTTRYSLDVMPQDAKFGTTLPKGSYHCLLATTEDFLECVTQAEGLAPALDFTRVE